MPERIGTKILDKPEFDEQLTQVFLQHWVAGCRIKDIPASQDPTKTDIAKLVDIIGIDSGVMRQGRSVAKLVFCTMLDSADTREGLYTAYEEFAEGAAQGFESALEVEPVKSIIESIRRINGEA